METASSAADEAPWDEIERNYFASVREQREQQMRALEDAYRAKNNEIKSAMLDNYRAQSELLNQLQELRDQDLAQQAALKTLEEEFEAVRNARTEEYAREDEAKRLWFRRFRRDGLAYRTADAPRSKQGGAVHEQMPDAEEVAHGHVQEEGTAGHDISDAGGAAAGRDESAPETRNDTTNGNGHQDEEVEGLRAEPHAESAEAVLGAPAAPRTGELAPKVEADVEPVENVAEAPNAGALTGKGTNAVDSPHGADAAPDVPGSPLSSLSSELSSRHTTPELDTPLSQPKGTSRPSTPEDPIPNGIEVYDDSLEFVGRLGPTATSNPLTERMMALPIKRSIRIRKGRKFTHEDLESIAQCPPDGKKGAKWLSLYIQATGEVQGRPCQSCSRQSGPYQECVILDEEDLPRCGNCEWTKNTCHGASLQGARPRSHQSASDKSVATGTPASQSSTKEGVNDTQEATSAARKPLRRPLPDKRKAQSQAPVPLAAASAAAEAEDSDTEDARLPEITKEVLCLRHDGMVFTDPPIMRGVPLTKISPDHPYWESNWVPTEDIVEPILKRYQERYEKLEADGTKPRDKHLANRDVKRGHMILRFLREWDVHPYQLVGKEFINPKITSYEALYRMAQLLMEDLPRFNLDVTPTEWLRHRIHEVYLENRGKLNLAAWLEKAYSDPKVEQGRKKNGLPNIGRPPRHRMSQGGGGESAKKKATPRPLKRKEPHSTPEPTPRRADTTAAVASATPASSTGHHKGKGKAKQEAPPGRSSGSSPPNKRSRVAPPSASHDEPTTTQGQGSSSRSSSKAPSTADLLAYDGYTSTDSISADKLMKIDWRVQQVKTRDIASNSRVTQYWHWLGGAEGLFEHQVLRSVRPPKWSVFKDPYDFHLRIAEVDRVMFSQASSKVVIVHRKGADGKEVNPRGDVMAQFKRERTKRRFLSFLKQRGVKLAEVTR